MHNKDINKQPPSLRLHYFVDSSPRLKSPKKKFVKLGISTNESTFETYFYYRTASTRPATTEAILRVVRLSILPNG